MKKILGIGCGLLLTFLAFAEENLNETALNQVIYQLSEKTWVSTKTALVAVHLNATLSNPDLAKARQDILQNLNKIASGEWHLSLFDRSQDTSGLEKLTVEAQARVDQAALTDIYKNAKSVSKPGMQYEIAQIEFKPSLEEIENAKNQLRQKIYQQVRSELVQLNKIYENQNYGLYRLIFMEGNNVPPMKMMQARQLMNTMVVPASQPSLAVSNELTMNAWVQLASNRRVED